MAKDADVVVENFRSDVKHRLKVDYETLSAINPRIVYGSISGFGQDGPYAARPGVDQIAQGLERPDERHRTTRQRALARRRAHHRPVRRPVPGPRHHGRA